MIVEVDGASVHASTGGVELTGSGPVLILIHGAGMDSTVWQLQTRFLAHRGIRAVAVDLPSHGSSKGNALTSITDMATWVRGFTDAAGFDRVHVAGHSMGTLIALRLAASHPEQIESLVLLGAASRMPVHPDLLDAAANDLPRAAALMAAWGHDTPARTGPNPTPGLWMVGGSRALVETSRPGVLSADFAACVGFDDAEALAAQLSCPVTIVVGMGDKMTPPRSAGVLAQSIGDVNLVELAGIGHMMMHENPRAIRSILAATTEPNIGVPV